MNRDEAVATATVPSETPVEAIIARHTVRRVVWVGPPLIALFTVLSGWTGAWSSALGVAVVVANFLVAGAMLTMAIRISLATYQAAALFGFFLRFGLLTATMFLIITVIDVDRMAFGMSAVVSYIVLLALESIAVVRGRERDLDWTS